MVLHDIRLYGSPGKKHIHIAGGIIRKIADNREALRHISDCERIELSGSMALPGFINSHDHLDFNCYPAAGNRRYNNYTEWGRDIQQTHASVIAQVKKIPLHLRVQWGLLKNLLGGFTTVVNHGAVLDTGNDGDSVLQRCTCLHSPAFENNWVWKLNRPFQLARPVVMHIGEGTDQLAKAEINRVIQKNYFRRKIVAVHGVAMDPQQAAKFHGLVWCPASNFFLLGSTAAVQQLKKKITIVFGTDSTLTAPWEGYLHFEEAMQAGGITEAELVNMLTVNAARLWQLHDRGVLAEGKKADLLVLRDEGPLFTGFNEKLQLIIRNGECALAGSPCGDPLRCERIQMGQQLFYVRKGAGALFSAIHHRYPGLYQPFREVQEVLQDQQEL